MGIDVLTGAFLAISGGVMMGNAMVPLKRIRTWHWENTWLVFSFVALALIPWSLALLTVPHLGTVYSLINRQQLAVPLLYGVGWGVANVLFGLAVVRIGMALTFAITIGLSSALGTLIPLVFHEDQLFDSAKGLLILGGVFIMLAGIGACSWAGRQREQVAQIDTQKPQQKGTTQGYRTGLWMALVAGLLAPMLNYALAFGGDIVREAVRHGATAANAPYAVWPVALGGGLIVNASYSIYLLFVNKTWRLYQKRQWDFALSACMGILFIGAVSVYGMGTTYLGPLGASIGWALFQIFIIMAANVSGLILGEWKGLGKKQAYALWSGLALLTLATVVIAYGT